MERAAKELHEKLDSRKEEKTRLFFEFIENKTHGDALHQADYNGLSQNRASPKGLTLDLFIILTDSLNIIRLKHINYR